MAGQIAEYISTEELTTWTDIEEVLMWFDEAGFTDGKVYSIYNNSATTFRFLTGDIIDDDIYGTIVTQGSNIYFRPSNGSKLYIKGFNFNLAVSEIK